MIRRWGNREHLGDVFDSDGIGAPKEREEIKDTGFILSTKFSLEETMDSALHFSRMELCMCLIASE